MSLVMAMKKYKSAHDLTHYLRNFSQGRLTLKLTTLANIAVHVTITEFHLNKVGRFISPDVLANAQDFNNISVPQFGDFSDRSNFILYVSQLYVRVHIHHFTGVALFTDQLRRNLGRPLPFGTQSWM
jgi:hypothetical protein